MDELSCTGCEYLADFAGNYVECTLLHRFVDWYYWRDSCPDDCPKEGGSYEDEDRK